MPENGRLSASGLSWENTDDFRRKHASKGLKAEAGRQAGRPAQTGAPHLGAGIPQLTNAALQSRLPRAEEATRQVLNTERT